MSRPFNDVESTFRLLQRRFRDNEISRREFIDQLKKLRLRDDQGRVWMIGAQTGRWYYFDGREWVQSEPPADETIRPECPSCGKENEEGAETCAGCGEPLRPREAVCPNCGARLESPFQKCPACNREAGATPYAEEGIFAARESARGSFILKRISPLSLFSLAGGAGIILGIVAGAFAGASEQFSGLARRLPDFLGSLHGTLMGGIMFGVMGGAAGLLFAGLLGYLLALLFNLIASVTGGVKLTGEKPEVGQEKKQ